MIHLGVETSTEVVDMALLENEILLVRLSVLRPGGASELLVPGLETLLEMADKKSESIGLISSSAGPGTYTSIRVGHLFCKGLSFAKGIPHLTVSPFLVLAEQAISCSGRDGDFLVVLLDARRGEVNACLFDPADISKPVTLSGPAGEVFSGRAMPPGKVLDVLPPGKGRIVGPGVLHLPQGTAGKRPDLSVVHDRPEAETMGRLALRRLTSDPDSPSSGDTLLYGRDSVIA